MKGNTLAIALCVVGILIGGLVGHYAFPATTEGGVDIVEVEVEKIPLQGSTIKIGLIVAQTSDLETAQPMVESMMEPDYNAYAEALGYDVDFQYLVDDATSQAAVHLEKVQGFKAMDVSVFIGGAWSSQAQASLSYCNDNNMLMWSSSCTSPLLGLEDDSLYRMCPDDKIQAPAISRMLESQGVQYIVILQRADAWADGIMTYFVPDFTDRGGVILDTIRYQGETTEFSNYLQSAENTMKAAVEQYGADKCAVEIISFSEAVTMVTQAQDYPTIYGLNWYGSDGTVLTQQFLDDAPTQATHLKIFSTYAAPAESNKFQNLYDRYYTLVSQPFGYYVACRYDIGWVLAETMLEAQSIDAIDIIPLQATTCYNTFGASGWTQLNEFDDRMGGNYQIWGYGDLGDGVQNVVYGLYDFDANDVTWETDLLGYTPVSRVGTAK